MLASLIVVVVVAGALALWWLLRRGTALRTPPQATRRPATAPSRAPVPTATPPATPVATPRRTVVAPLPDDGQLARHESLTDERRQALLVALQQLPRPPRALQQMVSPDSVARASSSELADLVMTEPVVAARVMAAVNAPLYALRTPVTSVGQAITFLGLNAVRNLCLQHLLRESLAVQDPALRREFDILWQTSAVAGELCLAVAKRLQLPDAGAMSTQLVLHFLGRFAAATLAPQQALAHAASIDLPMRARALAEQAQLGVSAGEIGTMLMHDWGLPAPMVEPTRDIARIVFATAPAPDTSHAARLALCALCASLAERIVRKDIVVLHEVAPQDDPHDDLQALRPHLPAAHLAAVSDALRDPDMARVLS